MGEVGERYRSDWNRQCHMTGSAIPSRLERLELLGNAYIMYAWRERPDRRLPPAVCRRNVPK